VDDVAPALRLLYRQLVPGALVDQQFDERQPLRFIDRFGEQSSITRVIESRILSIHSRAPHLHSPNGLFRNASDRAIRFRFAPRAIHRSMVDDGLSEKSQASCREAGAHGGVSSRGKRRSYRSTPFVTEGLRQDSACLARPDRTINIPPGRNPGRARAERKDDAR
jgi:hypothetical protein